MYNMEKVAVHHRISEPLFALYIALLIILPAPGICDDTLVQPKMEVAVYYETLCPDSIYFIRQQLYSAMLLKSWLQYTNLKFVPYGNVASWTDPKNNKTILHCQHGVRECELNALHACIVEHNDIAEQLRLIDCMLGSYPQNINECGEKLQTDVTAAKNCKATRSTPDILRKYGTETDRLEVSFVPTVTFDGEFDRSNQMNILYNFSKVFCEKFYQNYNIIPTECKINKNS